MRELPVRFMVVAIACGAILAEGPVLDAARESGRPGMAATQAAGAVDHQAAAEMFTARLAEYETTRARLEKRMPTFDDRRDPWSLMLSRRYLASATRAARPWARQGTLFSRSSRARSALIEQHVPAEQRQRIAADAVDEGYVTLTVQEPVPAWAMQPAPEPLRQALLPLPEGIEYRVVAPSLILWDAYAEILIDVLPGAFLPRVGILVASERGMSRKATIHTASRKATPILRWTFQREAATLTCEIDVADDSRFEVSVVPHWDLNASVIERFDAPMTALERHARIAMRLREAGWAVTDRAAA